MGKLCVSFLFKVEAVFTMNPIIRLEHLQFIEPGRL